MRIQFGGDNEWPLNNTGVLGLGPRSAFLRYINSVYDVESLRFCFYNWGIIFSPDDVNQYMAYQITLQPSSTRWYWPFFNITFNNHTLVPGNDLAPTNICIADRLNITIAIPEYKSKVRDQILSALCKKIKLTETEQKQGKFLKKSYSTGQFYLCLKE